MQVFRRTALIASVTAAFALWSTWAAANPARLHLICDEWPPYQIVGKDGISGFSTAVVTKVLDRMDIRELRLDAFPWKRAMMMIERGMADGLFSTNYTEARTAFALYPDEPIVDSPWVMWVREEDRLALNSWRDLKGLTVGLVRGYSYTPQFWRFMKAQGRYEQVVDDEQNFRKLDAGRVDVIVAELGNGLYLLDQLGLQGIIPLERHPIKVDGLYLIFRKGRVSPAFVRGFSRELALLKQTPFYRTLYETHFNTSKSPSLFRPNR